MIAAAASVDEHDVHASAKSAARPHIVVFSSLFPSGAQPNAGLFIRERMFRVRGEFALTVVSPVAWFPLQGLLRLVRPGFRPRVEPREVQDGIEIHRPRYLSIPGIAKWLDGISMAFCTFGLVRRLKARHGAALIDAHFAYPDGYAASRLGSWLRLPVTVTLRGTEVRMSVHPRLRGLVRSALQRVTRIFAVSSSLKELAVQLGIDDRKIRVIGNGVDLGKFVREPREQCRKELDIATDAPVLVSVGGLTERKGFHRVIDCLPELVRKFPSLVYLVVGGGSPEGDWGPQLKEQVAKLGMERHVRFLGPLPPARLKVPLSAADVFVLATSNEGWANVFLEAMACGLPVVTTDVGGNPEVVCRPELGTIVAFGDPSALRHAIEAAIGARWDREAIVQYAKSNSWDRRIDILTAELKTVLAAGTGRSGESFHEGIRHTRGKPELHE